MIPSSFILIPSRYAGLAAPITPIAVSQYPRTSTCLSLPQPLFNPLSIHLHWCMFNYPLGPFFRIFPCLDFVTVLLDSVPSSAMVTVVVGVVFFLFVRLSWTLSRHCCYNSLIASVWMRMNKTIRTIGNTCFHQKYCVLCG